jgi:hypothetical protein
MNQSILERAMLKKYNEQQAEVKAARGIVPTQKDKVVKEQNKKLSLRRKWGFVSCIK